MILINLKQKCLILINLFYILELYTDFYIQTFLIQMDNIKLFLNCTYYYEITTVESMLVHLYLNKDDNIHESEAL